MLTKMGLIAALSAMLSGCVALSAAGTAISSAAETVIQTGVGFVAKGVAKSVSGYDEEQPKAPVEERGKVAQ